MAFVPTVNIFKSYKMKKITIVLLLAFISFSVQSQVKERIRTEGKKETKGYKIGDKTEDFQLKNVDGKIQSLSMMENAKGYIVVFTSNECPFALAYEDRLIQLHNEMAPKGYPVVAINSNDGAEGGGNTEQDMINRHKEKGFPFVYLKDANQEVYPKFGATKTPHVFILDKEMTVQYIGAIDDNSREPEKVDEKYVAQAIAALEMGKSPNPATTKAIGCPISSKGGGKGKRGHGRKGPPSPDKILEMMDANKDQQISREEVRGPLGRDFDRIDANNDGFLNKEELSKIVRPE